MWDDNALCRGMHSDIFIPPAIPEERTAPEAKYYEIAKMVCEPCPIRLECLLSNRSEPHGVWGGQSPKERHGGNLWAAPAELPIQFMGLLPKTNPDTRVDIPQLAALLREFTIKRPPKKRVRKNEYANDRGHPNERASEHAGRGCRSSDRAGVPQTAAALHTQEARLPSPSGHPGSDPDLGSTGHSPVQGWLETA